MDETLSVRNNGEEIGRLFKVADCFYYVCINDSWIPFQSVNKLYQSNVLFGVFSTRVPNNRPEVLEYYKLTEYNQWELLKKTKGILPTDNISCYLI